MPLPRPIEMRFSLVRLLDKAYKIHCMSRDGAAKTMSDDELKISDVDEVWVTVPEAVLLVGYDRTWLAKLANDMSKKNEDEREVRVRRRIKWWELWLPDLIVYMGTGNRGPRVRRKKALDK